ncbi:MAG: PAC2 family protein [Chloroflexi bacterium]|nr:PAC2 family protein [Chloroflexota bacterium]
MSCSSAGSGRGTYVMDNVVFLERPELSSPYLVLAFGGWPDAAEVATRGINHLVRQLKAKHFAEINAEEFFNFTQSRPMMAAEDGAVNQIRFPTIEAFFWKATTGDHDLILVRGVEPELKWKTFADTLTRFAQELGVSRMFTLGGLYDNLPHTRKPKVSGLVNALGLKKLLAPNGVRPVAYRGPAAIHTVLLATCARAKIEMISLWGHPPFYMRPEANPRVCMALVETLSRFVGITVDLQDLKLASEQTDHALDHLVADNPLLRSQVKEMEDIYDSEARGRDRPLESTDAVIRDVEDFLRNEGSRD